ncbi:MAG: DUF951 domain-containing protein [bacterium]|nr:DUF951 domain-containing protein [bacterium]
MNINVGDTLIMKKKHPCGSCSFTVLRTGMDIKIKCNNCSHEVMLPRFKIERNIKQILSKEDNITNI